MKNTTHCLRSAAHGIITLLAASAVLAGCGSEGSADRSGSRLSHHGWVSGEASAYRRTLDTELDMECSMATAEDGLSRCLPVGEVFSTEWYANADCSSDAVVVGSTYGVYGRFGRLMSEPSSCGPSWTMYELTLLDDTDLVYVKEDAGCVERPGGARGFAYAERRAPEAFVEVSRKAAVASGGFGVEMWRGDDGSRLRAGGWDARFGSMQVMELTEPAGERLVPAVAGTETAYHSSGTCTDPVYVVPQCLADSVGMVLGWVSYDDPPRALRVGEAVPHSELFDDFNEDVGCSRSSSESVEGNAFFTPGAPFASDELAEITQALVGSGSVQMRADVVPNGAVVGAANPPLAQDGVPCTPVAGPTPDRAVCVPGVARESDLGMKIFADSDCVTSPLISGAEENSALSPGDAVIERLEPVEGDKVFAVWVVEQAHSGKIYWDGPDGCVYEPDMWDPNEPFWVIAAAGPDRFAALEDRAL